MLGRLFIWTMSIILMMNAVFANELLHNQKRYSCAGENSSISQLQGEAKHSPYVIKKDGGSYKSQKSFTVKGVVTQLKQGRDAGFYMQQTTKSSLSLASKGIFVNTGEIDRIQPNMLVCVTGIVEEYYGLTQLRPISEITILGRITAIEPTEMLIATADANFRETLERYEGMYVRLVNLTDMRVTKPLYYDRRWQRYHMILSHKVVNIHPNTKAFPSSILADQQALENKQRRLYLQLESQLPDEGVKANALASIRVNDKVSGIVGTIQFNYGEFRLIVDEDASNLQFESSNVLDKLPPRKKHHLRIASFNLLNYFNTAAGGAHNPLRHNRGATSLLKLQHQEAKLVNTIIALDADFIGLMEVENNGFGYDSAIQRLLALVNRGIKDPVKHYAIVIPNKSDLHQARYLGSGAITVAGLYRPFTLKLIRTRVINLPVQRSILGNAYHRPSLTPTFTRVINHKKSDQQLTISVNHFKSKGSKCFEDKQRLAMLKRLKSKRDDNKNSLDEWRRASQKSKQGRQGYCAQFRTSAANILAQTLTEQAGNKIILGDLNSYPKEDPLLALTDYKQERYAYYKIIGSAHSYLNKQLLDLRITKGFDYHDPFNQDNHDNWTYSFQALGRLDYILLSAGLLPDLITKKVWHINANVSPLSFQHQRYSGNKNAVLSSSDHDPLFIDLK